MAPESVLIANCCVRAGWDKVASFSVGHIPIEQYTSKTSGMQAIIAQVCVCGRAGGLGRRDWVKKSEVGGVDAEQCSVQE